MKDAGRKSCGRELLEGSPSFGVRSKSLGQRQVLLLTGMETGEYCVWSCRCKDN